MSGEQGKPPYPPFTAETAKIKVKAAQDAWNTKYGLERDTCLSFTLFPDSPADG